MLMAPTLRGLLSHANALALWIKMTDEGGTRRFSYMYARGPAIYITPPHGHNRLGNDRKSSQGTPGHFIDAE